ncbi:MAG: hypothetical protein ACYS26_02665 [Planctomycetota bacterium]
MLAALVAGVAAWAIAPPRDPGAGSRNAFASARASIQLVRVQTALDAGRPELAVQRALDALDANPRSTAAWEYVLTVLLAELPSPQLEGDPIARAGWFELGLELADRGATEAEQPERVALRTGLLLFAQLQLDDPVPFEGGAAGLGRACLDWLARAADLGSVDAAQLLEAVEARVLEARDAESR